ncbi:3-oxoacyl-[acyl-carrier-protein] synthase III C-terminal domain-containing protein [Streptomyces sp. NPDC057052]|uniref:3-oxoacyl-[acyl-carrier-protein] synthase III C-terminal domain-containing protein n=1 Tax=Streptomyces sp. NPDC057052 TaxID=3346010 RepID=UPI00364377F0
MTYGITAFGTALGEPCSVEETVEAYTDDRKKVEDWGYRRYYRAPDGTGLTDLAAAAGRRALDRAGMPADRVDLVVLAMADIPEYLYWDPAVATQAKLGTHRAEALLVNQACSSGVLGFDAAAGKFATHPDYGVALLITVNRVCEAYWNRMDSSTAITSDGAAAAVLVRDADRCRWLATEVISDGRYANVAHLPGGGAARPVTPEHPDPGRVGNPVALMNAFLGHDLRAKVRFMGETRDNSIRVLERACARAGVPVADVSHLLHMNGTAQGLAEFARDMGVPLERTNAEVALDHGHLGCADQLFSLATLLDARRIPEGAVVALSSTGNGMHWGCTLLRV